MLNQVEDTLTLIHGRRKAAEPLLAWPYNHLKLQVTWGAALRPERSHPKVPACVCSAAALIASPLHPKGCVLHLATGASLPQAQMACLQLPPHKVIQHSKAATVCCTGRRLPPRGPLRPTTAALRHTATLLQPCCAATSPLRHIAAAARPTAAHCRSLAVLPQAHAASMQLVPSPRPTLTASASSCQACKSRMQARPVRGMLRPWRGRQAPSAASASSVWLGQRRMRTGRDSTACLGLALPRSLGTVVIHLPGLLWEVQLLGRLSFCPRFVCCLARVLLRGGRHWEGKPSSQEAPIDPAPAQNRARLAMGSTPCNGRHAQNWAAHCAVGSVHHKGECALNWVASQARLRSLEELSLRSAAALNTAQTASPNAARTAVHHNNTNLEEALPSLWTAAAHIAAQRVLPDTARTASHHNGTNFKKLHSHSGLQLHTIQHKQHRPMQHKQLHTIKHKLGRGCILTQDGICTRYSTNLEGAVFSLRTASARGTAQT